MSMVDHISEIGGEMVDQLIGGIREHCASAPNPLLAPERHFFRELATGLVSMSHGDLLTLCAAAITRIAYPDLQIQGGARQRPSDNEAEHFHPHT
ncbi:hypothetical protein [Mycolicibacterium lutetiense]|uniref:TetR family transcriptional regulator n=1 Tax=Mycolicibacterium lutetiense TaxID=1641992 RepID=A0ABS5A3E3_9MYCO|nr:hypothetical protein [Mycolicibacterium lutetiense]MBP2456268.1 hypothetical protein [Mycolicibacterium lutetiense]